MPPCGLCANSNGETSGGDRRVAVYYKRTKTVIPFDTLENRALVLLIDAFHPEDIEFINNNNKIRPISNNFLTRFRDIVPMVEDPKDVVDRLAAVIQECDNGSYANNQEDETVAPDNQEDKEQRLDVCAVCLDDLCRKNETIVTLDCCGHQYHYACITNWQKQKKSCPLCKRTSIIVNVLVANLPQRYRRLCVKAQALNETCQHQELVKTEEYLPSMQKNTSGSYSHCRRLAKQIQKIICRHSIT